MAEKGSSKKYNYVAAFAVGIGLMVLVYLVFEPTTMRSRTGSTDSVDTQTSGILSDAAGNLVVKTSGGADAPVSPSAFLGVEIMPVDSVVAEQLGITGKNGVLVNGIVPGSPAERAELQRGDVIVALNNRTVKDVDRFREIMADLSPGDNVRIVFVRDGKKDSTHAELVESPAIVRTAAETDSNDSDWGVSLAPISPALRNNFGIPAGVNGVVILSVVPGGLADEAGLMSGDVITGIDKTPISDMSDFFGALSSDDDDTALLDIYSRGNMRYVPLDSSTIEVADQTRDQATLRQKIFSIFTGGMPFGDDEEEEDEGPKGGKFAQDNIELTADNSAWNRPSEVPGDENTGGTAGPSSTTGMNRPSTVPSQTSGSTNDVVLFIGLLVMAIMFLAYREFCRPPELDKNR